MATTNLLSSVLLANGDESAEVTIAESSERVNLRLQSVQVGSASSQARLVVVDDQTRIKATVVIDGSGTKEVEIERIDGVLTLQVACNLGNCRVTLDEVTGSEGATGEGPGAGGVETGDLADLAVTTAKLALLAVDTGQIAALAIETAKCEVGLLSADVGGRALIADDHFTPAEFVAGAGGKFAADCMDAAACANVYPAGAIPVAKVASAPLSLEGVTADPGTGVALPANLTTSIAITTAAAETNTLAAPSAVGKVLSLTLDVRVGGDRVITVATAINQAGDTVITMDTAGDNIVLVGVQIAGVPAWRVLVNDGTTLS